MPSILQRVMKLVPLTSTGPEIYVATMTTVLFNAYGSLVDNMNHMKSIKLKNLLGENVADCPDAILVDAERLESAGAFNPEHLGYTICIFDDTSDYRFRPWVTQKYKEVMDFIKKLCMREEDVMCTDDSITYEYLVKEAMH